MTAREKFQIGNRVRVARPRGGRGALTGTVVAPWPMMAERVRVLRDGGKHASVAGLHYWEVVVYAKPSPARGLHLRPTPDQARDFARCARVAGADLEDWIIQCAAVQAANVIDTLQTEARRKRNLAGESAPSKAVNVRRRAARRTVPRSATAL